MTNYTQAGGMVEASHWHDSQDELAAIEDSIRSGEMLDSDVTVEQVFTDDEASGSDVSFDQAMEETRLAWRLELEQLQGFNSDMSGLRSF